MRLKHVLLAGSVGEDREMYTEYLQLNGYQPVEADDLPQALAIAGSVDLVVAGWQPGHGLDTVQLVRALCSEGGPSSIPIIVVVPEDARSRWPEESGCTSILIAPPNPYGLLEEIERRLASLPEQPPDPAAAGAAPVTVQWEAAGPRLSAVRDPGASAAPSGELPEYDTTAPSET